MRLSLAAGAAVVKGGRDETVTRTKGDAAAVSRAAAGTISAGAPMLLPFSIRGAGALSRRIGVGIVGCGRIARTLNIPGILAHHTEARIVAVSDVDRRRMEAAKVAVVAEYVRLFGAPAERAVRTFSDYRDLIADPAVDAVMICTPDHWHAQPTIEAALAGKDIFLQKPLSLTIREGRQMVDVVRKTGRILQVGSQLRSAPHFRLACDLVRCGRIGRLREVVLGTPAAPPGGHPAEMPVPEHLDYDMWLGSTPWVYYTEDRVHPQNSVTARPGWLRCEQFGAGMITGWGAHDVDVAQWGMGTDLSGPLEVEGKAVFPKSGLWNIHGPFRVEARYAGGVTVRIDDKTPSSVRFVGHEGWILVSRGRYTATPSDPASKAANAKALSAAIRGCWNTHSNIATAVPTRARTTITTSTGWRAFVRASRPPRRRRSGIGRAARAWSCTRR